MKHNTMSVLSIGKMLMQQNQDRGFFHRHHLLLVHLDPGVFKLDPIVEMMIHLVVITVYFLQC